MKAGILFLLLVIGLHVPGRAQNISIAVEETGGAFVWADKKDKQFFDNTSNALHIAVPAGMQDSIKKHSYLLAVVDGTAEHQQIAFPSAGMEAGKPVFVFGAETIGNNQIRCIFVALSDGKKSLLRTLHGDDEKRCIVPASLARFATQGKNGTGGTTGETAASTPAPLEIPPFDRSKSRYHKGSTGKDCPDCDKVVWTKKEKVYYYDPECGSLIKYVGDKKTAVPANLKRERIVARDNVQIRISNINRYLYRISYTGRSFADTTTMPLLWRQLFFGDDNGILGTLISAVSTRLGGAAPGQREKADIAKDNATGRTAQQLFVDALFRFNYYLSAMKEAKMQANTSCFRFPCCNDSLLDFKFDELRHSLLEVRTRLAVLQSELKENPETAKAHTEYLRLLGEQRACMKNNQRKARIAELTAIGDRSEAETAELKALSNGFINDPACTPEQLAALSEQIAQQRLNLSLPGQLNDAQNSLPTDAELEQLYNFVIDINSRYNNFSTGPIPLEGERVRLELSFMPVDSAHWKALTPLIADIPIAGRTLLRFSSGAFAGIGLQQKQYSWQPVPEGPQGMITDTSRFILAPESYSNPPVGFAAMLHAQWKIAPWIGLGLGAGVGITLESSPRLASLAGGSLFLGDKNQLAVTYGIAGMNTQHLTRPLETAAERGTLYPAALRPAITYSPEFRLGSFLAVTYVIPLSTTTKLF